MSDFESFRRSEPEHQPALNNPILTRVVGLVRGFTGVAGVITFGVLAAEAVLPAPIKPSMLIGSFHGRIEAADANAKRDSTAAFTRTNASAAAEPPGFTAMETEAFRQQQQVLADALQTQSAIANFGDAACVIGQLIPRDDKDWGSTGGFLRNACGVGDQVRQNMVQTLKRGGQDNSVLIQRPRAGGGQ